MSEKSRDNRTVGFGALMSISLALLFFTFPAQAELKVNPLFTDHMVVQRNQPVAVYGTANAGDSITVEFSGRVQTAVVDSEGNWKAVLDPMPANSTGQVLIVSSRNSNSSQQFSDVLVGDVWLCAGQSNMATPMKAYPTLKDEIPTMQNHLVRLFKTKHGGVGCAVPSDVVVPDSAFEGSWQALSPEFAADFSAVACFFGRALQSQAGVPIGLLSANRGGTMVNQWLPMDVMENKPNVYSPFLDKSWRAWTPDPMKNPDAIHAPSYLYNGTIHPLIRYSIRGVIWYQGESDVVLGFVPLYSEMIKDLVESWRSAWGYEFPFLSVQLPAYGGARDNSGESWAWLREAQLAVLNLPGTEVAVAVDAGEYKDIHPQNKQPIGERLARLASSLDDGSIKARSPMINSVRFENGRAYIRFVNTGEGLESRRVAMNRNGSRQPGEDTEAFIVSADTLSGFIICGQDQYFKTAHAALVKNDTVCVWSEEVPSPVAVRYAWGNFPLGNLYNSEGLPAFPFRTDSFEIPDFDQRPSFSQSNFEIKNPEILMDCTFDGALSDWVESSPQLVAEQSNGWLRTNLQSGSNESFLTKHLVEPGNRFQMQADLKVLPPGGWGGVVFNYKSTNDFYVFRFRTGTVHAQFIRYINRSPRVLLGLQSSKPFAVGARYRLEVSVLPNPPLGDGIYSLKITDIETRESFLEGMQIDFSNSMPGGAVGCFVSTPGVTLMFDRLTLLTEKEASAPRGENFNRTDSTGTPKFTSGCAGFYLSCANANPTYDNLSMENK